MLLESSRRMRSGPAVAGRGVSSDAVASFTSVTLSMSTCQLYCSATRPTFSNCRLHAQHHSQSTAGFTHSITANQLQASHIASQPINCRLNAQHHSQSTAGFTHRITDNQPQQTYASVVTHTQSHSQSILFDKPAFFFRVHTAGH